MSKIQSITLCLSLIFAFSIPAGLPSATAQEKDPGNSVQIDADSTTGLAEPEPEEEKEEIVVVAGDDFFDDFGSSSDEEDEDHGISIDLDGKSGGKMLAAIIICAIIFFSPAIFLGVILYYFYRRRKLANETVFLLAEKGVEIPPALLRPQRNDLRNGILLITGGIGLTAFFLATVGDLWGLGLFPLFLGLGYMIVWKLGNKEK